MPPIALLVSLGLLLSPAPLPARDGIDLHAYWDQRCAGCHGDAGAFARRSLQVDRGRLVGVHHRDDLALFLRQHYLADPLVAPVIAMLTAQATSAPVYAERCSGCHGKAADFVRQTLTVRDGVLQGKTSRAPVAAVLARHGGLSPAEGQAMHATLMRVAGEVHGPPVR